MWVPHLRDSFIPQDTGGLIFATAKSDTFNSIPISGILKKISSKSGKRITIKNHVPKSPQSAVNPPQTHHEFTIKNHHIFANPLQKDPAKPQKFRSEKSRKEIRRR